MNAVMNDNVLRGLEGVGVPRQPSITRIATRGRPMSVRCVRHVCSVVVRGGVCRRVVRGCERGVLLATLWFKRAACLPDRHSQWTANTATTHHCKPKDTWNYRHIYVINAWYRNHRLWQLNRSIGFDRNKTLGY